MSQDEQLLTEEIVDLSHDEDNVKVEEVSNLDHSDNLIY